MNLRNGTKAWKQSSGGRQRLDDADLHADIVTSSVRIGADLVRLGDEGLGLGAGETGEGDLQRDLETKAAFGTRTDAHGGGNSGVGWNLWAALRSNELHG